ncbi:hypothetical protein SERLADRAFT_409559 [Serpula lacrymans var. lacrymans S7.9]|uniref:Uncharacterized protein n=1 Tax=Serpula lacrymans var. lacrymans (strain S7.9) TaxID=578457 RepID=F8P1V3_SERL9|nr:uncharacterized protein SERLADRAFT_409559 [Serpula lacrymans var. lacrymans S7.9]EGO23131.1 hypothetical protein SERLADRAFT_409559 [Serpula lacrymans var. lacrymans S7.9]
MSPQTPKPSVPSDIPSSWKLRFTELAAQCVLFHFRQALIHMHTEGPNLLQPEPGSQWDWNAKLLGTFVSKCKRAAGVLVIAYLTKMNIQWDATLYAEQAGPCNNGQNNKLKQSISEEYLPAAKDIGIITIPSIIIDIHGRIVLCLRHLKQNMDSKHPKKPSKSWHQSSKYYKNPRECQLFPFGLIDLSLAWLQLGHEQTGEAPRASQSLCKSTPPGTGELWLQSSVETGALMSAILRVAHPALYELAWEVPGQFEDHMDDVMVLKAWSLVFNALSIISNQEMPVHGDCLSKAEWYNMLASVGDYDEAILEPTGWEVAESWGFILQWRENMFCILHEGVYTYNVWGGDPGMQFVVAHSKKRVKPGHPAVGYQEQVEARESCITTKPGK